MSEPDSRCRHLAIVLSLPRRDIIGLHLRGLSAVLMVASTVCASALRYCDRMGDSDPTTVTLLLVEGDRQGAVIARLDGYESRAFSFVRADWFKVVDHPETGPLLDQPGVYVLTGRGSDAVHSRVYIGQASVLRSRLGNHLASAQKAWWERVYAFAGGLHRTSTAWLEAELIADAKAAKRVAVENGPTPNRPTLSWGDQQSMIQHYQRARLLFALLGVDAFDPLPGLTPPPATPATAVPTPQWTGRDVYLVVGEEGANWRRWEDWIKFGLVTGGGSKRPAIESFPTCPVTGTSGSGSRSRTPRRWMRRRRPTRQAISFRFVTWSSRPGTLPSRTRTIQLWTSAR